MSAPVTEPLRSARQVENELIEKAPNLAPPRDNPRFPLFDALRAIAALSVFAGHTVTEVFSLSEHPQLFVLAVRLADQGVAIFFAISGFLLYRPFVAARRAGDRLSLRDYAARRVARIVPAYWVALSIFLVLGWVPGVTGRNWPVFYGFGQVYSFKTIGGGIGAAWTLCVEVTFYAVLPLFAAAAARLERTRREVELLALLALAAVVFRTRFEGLAHLAASSTLPAMFLWFAGGMALAIASAAAADTPAAGWLARLDGRAVWAGALALFAVLYEVARPGSRVGTVPTDVITYVLAAGVALLVVLPGVFTTARATLPRRLLGSSVLRWIGLVSYGLFLYHTILIARLQRALHAHNVGGWAALVVLSLIASLAAAAASYYVVERPILRAVRTRARR